MFRIKRSAAPSGFNAIAKKSMAIARAFYRLSPEVRRQRTFPFDEHMPQAWLYLVAQALHKQFNGKCAYCETPINDVNQSNIDWFRPRGGVAENSGEFLADHYWAQAFAWENMYLCCNRCNRAKGSRFPVLGVRAPASSNRSRVGKESPLLLDPCADAIEKHLIFSADGFVSGVTDRGRVTIETLDLNRSDLIEYRSREAATYLEVLQIAGISSAEARRLRGSHQPYLGLKRALRRSHEESFQAITEQAKRDQANYDQAQESASVEAEGDLKRLRERARFIKRVRLENVASIDCLDLDLEASSSISAPCFAILGINGVGKSTILKAIALTLAGNAVAGEIKIKVRDFLRTGASNGRVLIWISGFNEPIEMKIPRKSGKFAFPATSTKMLVLGYGSTRLLPTEDARPETYHSVDSRPARIKNLFDPFRPITDINKWLRDVGTEEFDEVARTLKLMLPATTTKTDVELVRDPNGDIRVRVDNSVAHRLELLSDGYQSMLGLAADIMHTMFRHGFRSMRMAQGIVLIDELGNHLHPAWRMRIVESLRSAFPQIQFIFSTHDPLCLRGIRDGEVVVVKRREDGSVYALEHLPSVENMRVDQLLASEHFGLGSTIDPWPKKVIEELAELASKENRSDDEESKFQRVKKEITAPHLLSTNRAEQLYCEAVKRESEEQLNRPQVKVNARDLDERIVAQIQGLMRQARDAKKSAEGFGENLVNSGSST